MGISTIDHDVLTARLNEGPLPAHGHVRFLGEAAFGAERIARFTLGNGLKILLLRDASAKVISYHTWFGVGSRHERPGKTGLAHLFEHLMFNEVEGLAAGEFDRLLEMAGGEVNAATWVDWTFYYENIPSSEIELVIRLEALRMQKLVLREPQVVSEKEVVANERRYRVDDDVEGAISEALYKHAFTVHPYHWPTIGWMEDIQGFTTEDCQQFYATYYAPNNATVVIVGDLDQERELKLIQQHYGAIAASPLPEHTAAVEPEQNSERILTIDKPTPTEKVLLGYKGPALGTSDQAALTIVNEILFGGKSSRLYRALISEGELSSDARGSLSPFRDPGLYEIWVSMREGLEAKRALAVVDEALDRLGREPVLESELEKAKNRLELAFVQGMESASGRAEQIGFYETVLGDAGLIFAQLEAYRAVDAERVRDVCARLLKPSRRTVIFVRPSGEVEPGSEEEEAA